MTQAASQAPAGRSGRRQRRLRNYLLDTRFQLKYTGYLVAIALLFGGGLGGVVFWESQTMVGQGRQVSQMGNELVAESKKVSDVVELNLTKAFPEDPELAALFQGEDKERNVELLRRQKALKEQAEALEAQQTLLVTSLGIGLAVLVLAIAAAGIFVTHKIAGPVYKMKRHLREVGEGSLQIPPPLRKGDELVDFFETFATMVRSLRDRQEKEIAQLDAAIASVEASGIPQGDDRLQPLYRLREDMKAALEA